MQVPLVRTATPDWALLAVPRIVVTVWRAKVMRSAVDATDRAIDTVVRASADGKYASISVVEESVSMSLDESARDASARLMRRWGSHCVGSAYLVDAPGFLPAAVRTAIAGLALLTRAPHPVRVFDDATALGAWLAPRVSVPAPEIARTILRARTLEPD